MGCAHSRLRSRVDVRDLESIVRTGDLILFSSMHAASHVTKCFTASSWDHCGIVVKFSSKHVFVLEYAGGVYLYPLFTRIYTYYAIQGREISLRRLLPGQDRAAMQRTRRPPWRASVLASEPRAASLLAAGGRRHILAGRRPRSLAHPPAPSLPVPLPPSLPPHLNKRHLATCVPPHQACLPHAQAGSSSLCAACLARSLLRSRRS